MPANNNLPFLPIWTPIGGGSTSGKITVKLERDNDLGISRATQVDPTTGVRTITYHLSDRRSFTATTASPAEARQALEQIRTEVLRDEAAATILEKRYQEQLRRAAKTQENGEGGATSCSA